MFDLEKEKEGKKGKAMCNLAKRKGVKKCVFNMTKGKKRGKACEFHLAKGTRRKAKEGKDVFKTGKREKLCA